MTNTKQIDTQEFRGALGSFATGVTVVTTCMEQDNPIGVTASSFNSVSLDPPLVLWSLGKKSHSLSAFRESGHFAVHILSCLQEDLSNSFAKSGANKFDGVNWQPGALGSPVLEEFAAKFECRTIHQYEGGDHIIFVGEVVAFDSRDKAPLVFHGGRYAEAMPREKGSVEPTIDPEQGRFTQDFFLYLLSTAHFQTTSVTRKKRDEFGLNQAQYFAVAILSMNAPLMEEDLIARLKHTGHAPTHDTVESMIEDKLLKRSDQGLILTERARQMFIATLSETKAFEDDLLDHFTPGEISVTKRVLKRIIKLTGDDSPAIWDSPSSVSD